MDRVIITDLSFTVRLCLTGPIYTVFGFNYTYNSIKYSMSNGETIPVKSSAAFSGFLAVVVRRVCCAGGSVVYWLLTRVSYALSYNIIIVTSEIQTHVPRNIARSLQSFLTIC